MIQHTKLIVVLGMHRSGTSSITRGLQVLGVELGERMMQPLEGINDKGFWEDVDLTELNVEILNFIGSHWNCLAPISSNNVELLHKKGFFERAVAMLQNKVGSTPIYGFKDPRVAKLLPFWRDVFAHCQFDVSYVLAIRHPLSVAQSLLKRDGFEREHSYLLWLGHVITSLTYSMNSNRVLVDYDLLMQNPDHELNRIAKQLHLKVDQASLQKYKAEFLDQDLRHSTFHIDDLNLDNRCPNLVREMYVELLNVATDKVQHTDTELIHKIGRWSKEVERPEISVQFVDKLLKLISAETALEQAEIYDLTNKLDLCQLQNAQLSELIAQQSTLLDKLHSSRSWKLTRPLRAFANLSRVLFQTAVQIFQLIRLITTYTRTVLVFDDVKQLFKECLILVKKGGLKNVNEKLAQLQLILSEKISDEKKLGDPIRKLQAQIKKRAVIRPTIIFDHNGGGGSNTYTFEIIRNITQEEGHVLRVYHLNGVWVVQWFFEDTSLLYRTLSTKLLFTVLHDTASKDIILNSLYGYPDIPHIAENIQQLGKALNAKVDFKVHDFYSLCPSPHLSDFEQKYCGVPQDVDTCNKCLKINVRWYDAWSPERNRPTEIASWRKPFAQLLDTAQTVTFFDQSGVDIAKRGFKLNDEKVRVVPHVITHFTCDKSVDIDGPLHIGIFGTLSHIKGGHIVKEVCEYINAQGLDIPVTLVGHSCVALPSFVDVHGVYKTSELTDIVRSKGINIVLMLSPIPETFSYTISEAMQMGLPIVAFNIGAQGNRVSSYSMGCAIPTNSTPAGIVKKIQSTLRRAQELNITC